MTVAIVVPPEQRIVTAGFSLRRLAPRRLRFLGPAAKCPVGEIEIVLNAGLGVRGRSERKKTRAFIAGGGVLGRDRRDFSLLTLCAVSHAGLRSDGEMQHLRPLA
jgi:hypothetical protein